MLKDPETFFLPSKHLTLVLQISLHLLQNFAPRSPRPRDGFQTSVKRWEKERRRKKKSWEAEKGRKEKSEESREGGSGDAGTVERELGLGTPLAVRGARSSGARRGSVRRRGGGSGGGEELSQTSSSHRVDVERGP